jgi:hypothetical protein
MIDDLMPELISLIFSSITILHKIKKRQPYGADAFAIQ